MKSLKMRKSTVVRVITGGDGGGGKFIQGDEIGGGGNDPIGGTGDGGKKLGVVSPFISTRLENL